MTKTDWKPTEEMRSAGEDAGVNGMGDTVSDIIIAVQPLIAAQALEKAKIVVAEFLACDDLSQREGCNPARLKKAYADIRAMIEKETQG